MSATKQTMGLGGNPSATIVMCQRRTKRFSAVKFNHAFELGVTPAGRAGVRIARRVVVACDEKPFRDAVRVEIR